MSTTVGWPDILVRLVLAMVAGSLIGMNRSEHGRPAGLRTTLLVCLAATLTMILANLMVGMSGKRADGFVNIDVMRLPLGLLSGMGFIGAGAIVRRDDLVMGVTTAATLWYVTVLGLCLGAGQLVLGIVALGLGILVLEVLKVVEEWWERELRGKLTVEVSDGGPAVEELIARLSAHGFEARQWRVVYSENGQRREMSCQVRWRGRGSNQQPPAFVGDLVAAPGVLRLEWGP